MSYVRHYSHKPGGLGALDPSQVQQLPSGSVQSTGPAAFDKLAGLQNALNRWATALGKTQLVVDGVIGPGTLALLQIALNYTGNTKITSNRISLASAFSGSLAPVSTMFVAQHADDYTYWLNANAQYLGSSGGGSSVMSTLTSASSIFGNLFGGVKSQAPIMVSAPSSSGSSTTPLILIGGAMVAMVLLMKKGKK